MKEKMKEKEKAEMSGELKAEMSGELKAATKFYTFSIGSRNYRIKSESLSKIESAQQFEKHLIQEGIKQILFSQGSEEVMEVTRGMTCKVVPKEMIQFLLDYDMIEEYQF